jgi:peptidoglycan/LPS O-acetylase OafA/YrhL
LSATPNTPPLPVAAEVASARAAAGRERHAALDGLRGIAATAVLVHHCTEASVPAVAAAEGEGGVEPSGWAWWALHSPLHLALSGPEAVYIFFVLSGLVLAAPLAGRSVVWPRWWAARLARLYVPAWASLVLAAALLALLPRTVVPGRSPWLNGGASHSTLRDFAVDGTLLSGVVNGPLWSLRYEVLFSLLLPLYLCAFLGRGRVPLKLVAITASIVFGAMGGPLHVAVYRTALFLPMFAVGTMIGAYQADMTAWIAGRSRWQGAGLLAVATLALSARGWLPPAVAFREVVAVAGAALLVMLFMAHPGTRRAAERPTVQWLGRVSFSLYLVHVPILLAVVEVLPWPTPGLVHAVVIPVSLLTAAVFWRFVERPAWRLSKAIGSPRSRPVDSARDGRRVGVTPATPSTSIAPR